MENTKLILTVNDACEMLCMCRRNVIALIRRKDHPLPAIITARRYRIPRAALEKWILEEAERQTSGKR